MPIIRIRLNVFISNQSLVTVPLLNDISAALGHEENIDKVKYLLSRLQDFDFDVFQFVIEIDKFPFGWQVGCGDE